MPKCSYCNSNMVWGDGILEEGRWIEENCHRIKLLKRISILEKKTSSGKITLEEANEYKDCCQLFENIHHNKDKINKTEQNKQTDLPINKICFGKRTDLPINKICFGKRTDTQELLKSGELNEMLYFTEINAKPKMNAIYCPSPEHIISYSEQKLLESKKTDMQILKIHKDALQTKKKGRIRANRGINIGTM